MPLGRRQLGHPALIAILKGTILLIYLAPSIVKAAIKPIKPIKLYLFLMTCQTQTEELGNAPPYQYNK
jgi:hypothetical protein